MRVKKYTAPLAIHCVWNCADSALVEPLVEKLATLISRDAKKPFSLGVNIPLFVYVSDNAGAVPSDFRDVKAASNVSFVFTSAETVGRENWKKYYASLASKGKLHIVPVALNSKGLAAFAGINAIRYEDGDPDSRQQRCLIAMLHEIFRYGFVWRKNYRLGQEASLKVFLSHSKGDDGKGVEVVNNLRGVIDGTNMRSFFDATSISPGREFEKEISKHLVSDKCALVAVQTDGYSSRYWCQKEILLAKEHNIPILLIDYLSDAEDRSFPACANVPVTRINEIDTKKSLLILTRLLIEAIRCKYVKSLMSEYKVIGWLPKDAAILIRPPEVFSLPEKRKGSSLQMCYPEPPLYKDELAWLDRFKIKAFTPLQLVGFRCSSECLCNKTIGFSIADIAPASFSNNVHSCMLKAFACDLARHILAKGGAILYGGDLRHDGFTEYIISEASALQNRTGDSTAKVIDYLAWPLYVNNKEVLNLRSDYSAVLDIKEVPPADDIKHLINPETSIPPTTSENSYIWSRCLTMMREQSISSSDARICAGGKLSGYKGKMPGVLEEIIITIKNGAKPLFLCGGFGGVVGEVCWAIEHKALPECLTEEWQIQHNAGYGDLQSLAKTKGNAACYEELESVLCSENIADRLSGIAGLCKEEYARLMETPFIDECIYLTLKGLSRLSRR